MTASSGSQESDRDADSLPGSGRRLLLTGASGFVGNAIHPVLTDQGWQVRCASRDAAAAARKFPGRDWVDADVADREAVVRSLDGCDAALYLVHGMASSSGDYRREEVEQARNFIESAERAGVRRVAYLGGVTSDDEDASEHLRSRQDVGEVLRSTRVSTIELRASMVIGHGSLSWLIVRDLAARLPVMVLPSWLKSRTEPVGIADVVAALVGAIDLPLEGSAWFGLPGPEILSGRQILERTADVLGRPRPLMIEVPFLSPRLSSHWVRFVTRAQWSVAREIVVGLKNDLLARDASYWQEIGHGDRQDFATAARAALAAEQLEGPVPGPWGYVERTLAALPGARTEQAS